MDQHILRLTFSGGCRLDCSCALSFTARLKGLLGTRACERGDTVLLLMPCSSVHTWGMVYDLDLLFLGSDGTVMATYQGVRPRSMRSQRYAVAVLERPASDQPWPHRDEALVLAERVFDRTVSEHR